MALEPIGKTVIQVGLDDTKVTDGLTKLNAKMKMADNAWKSSLSTFKQSDRSIEKLGVSLKGMNDKLKVQQTIVAAHEKKVEKLAAEYGNTHTKVIKATAELEKQRATMGNLQRSVGEVTKELQDLQKAEQLSKSPWAQRQKELQAYSDKMTAMGDKAMGIGQNMSMTVTAPVTATFGAAIKKSMDFEAQMSRVGAIANASKSDLKAMTDQAMELGAQTSKSASEVAKGFEEMVAMGFSAKETMAAMPGVISASESSGADMAQTAKVMASSMNAFGLEASKSTHVADVLAQTANQSAADITDMEYALKYAAAPAKSLGMSLEETSAGIGMMVDAGLKGEQAGTTLRGALLGLLDPSEENSKRMEKMGIEITDASGNFVGLANLIDNLQGSMKGMTKTQKAATLSALVGKEAVSGMLVLMEGGAPKIDKMTKALEDSDGASAEAAKKMKDNLKGALEELGGAFETVGIQVGKDLTPMISGLAKGLQGLANGFSELPDWARKTAIGIGLIAAATGPTVLGIGLVAKSAGVAASGLSKLTGAYAKNTIAAESTALANTAASTTIGKQGKLLGGVTGLFTKFGKASGGAATSTGLLARAGGLLTGGLRLLTGPVGIALTAVTALYTGFKLAYKHVDWFRTGVDNTGKLLKEVAGSIDLKWAEDIGTTFKIGAGFARNLAGSLGDIAKKGIEMAPGTQVIKAGFGVINDAVSKATDKVSIYGNGVSKSTEKALKGYTNLSDKAKLELEKLRSSHKIIGDKQYNDLVNIYEKMTNTAVSKITQRRNREITGLQKLFSDTKGLKASEENKILAEAKSGANKEVQAVKEKQRQIKAIYSKAHKEKRALTNIEESKIVVLQQQMDAKVVRSLSKSEKEQRIILGRLKDRKKAISLQGAADVIKASAKERDESIKNAKAKKNKTIDEAIYQRDVTKKLSKDQADKIIKDAKRQYEKSKENAEKQHDKVVKEAQSQNKEVKANIDEQTGHVKSKWEKLKEKSTPIITGITSIAKNKFKDMYKGVTGWMSDTKEDVEGKWEKFKGTTKTLAGNVKDAAVDKFKEMYKGATGWVTSIGTFIDNAKKGISEKAGRLGKSVAETAIGGLNKMIDGINWVGKNLGMDKLPHIKYSIGTPGEKPKQKYNRGGGHPGGLATVADKGPGNGKGVRELVQFPDGRTALFEKETTFNMPKGTHVYSNKETEPILKGIKYSTGTKKKNLVEQIGDAANWTKHTAYGVAAKTGANAFTNSSKLVGGKKTANALKSTAKVGESVEDIMKYAADPNKLVDFILKKFGVDFSSIKALPKQILDSQFKKIKKGVADKFSEWFAAQDGGEGGDGRYIDLSHGINFGFMPSAAQAMAAGYPFPRRHLGLDIDYPYGTKVYSTVSGTATGASGWNGGFGQNVTIKSGILEVIFGHLSKLAFQGTKQVKPGDFLGLSGGDPARQGVNAGSSSGAHLHYEMRKNGVAFDPTNWLKQNNGVRKGASSGPSGVSGNASSWASVIRKAAAQMNERITNADVNAIVAQIHRESGGNQTIVQGNIGDINNLRGTPARGLLQYVPSTFANYAVKGHTNINSGYDQLLAFFNNRNWRANNPAGRSGWSPNGARKYADGGIIKKPHYGLVGEDGPEAIIPLDPKKKTRAQQLLAYANGVVNKDGRNYVKEPPKTHTVKSGDTLWGISQANKMTVSMLKQLNNLKSNLIFPKQILKLSTGAYKLVGAIKEHATAIKQSITKKPTTVKPKVQMTSITGVVSKFADGLIRSGTIFKDLKTSKTDLAFGKFLESKLKGLNSSNVKTVMTNVSDIKKKLTEIDKKNDKLIKTNTAKIKSATVKNFDEQLKIDNYKAEKALNGKKGTITVKTRIAARDTTMIDRNLAKSKLNKAAHEKDLKTLHAYEDKLLKKRATLKTKKEKENNAKLLASTKKRIADEQKQRDKEVANIKKYEAQRADALKLKYKTEKKYVAGRSASALDKLINTSTNNIGKNNTLIKNLKSENALYAKQSATLNKIKGAEILKSDVLKKIAARREQLVKMMEALKKKETSLKEEKQGFADSISENLQSYAGFGGARGHTARDFVSWMRYRLGKMRTFASNVQKLKGMGLDPKLIREMLAGGIENAIPKVEALVKGGGGYISQINSLQKEIDGVVKSISTEQSTSLFADELASNKRRQDVVTKAMKDNEVRLDKFRSGKDKVISMKSYTDLENKTSKYKYQAKPLPKKTTTSKTVATSGKYKVKSGDSLWLIANKYKTTVDNLKKLNGLKSNLIHPNQTLKVPGAAKSQKVVNLEAAKKKREDESTKLIVNTAKKLNVVGKNDKYAAQLQKEIADIRKSTTKKDDALVAKLEKEMKENKALTKEMVSLLSQILNKPTNVILDGQKVSKTVEKNIVTKAKTTARKTVTPKPKTPVRRKA